MAAYNARFNNQRLELEKNRLSLQNTEMKLAQMQNREQMILMEKEQTRMELENQDLQLKQQQTAIELEKSRNTKNNNWKSYTNKNSCNASKWSKRPISARFGWCSPS